MRDSTGIKLEQLIVHIINSRQTNGLILSERCIPLDRAGDLTQRLIDYFAKHIENSLQDSATKAARFKNETFNDGEVPQICQKLLHDGLDLVLGSKKVAECLKDIIDKDKRIALGNLVMCTYQAANYGEQKFIALMKIDPSDVFHQKIETDERNQQYVSFEIEKNIMPTTKERLQKCAFIKSLEPRHKDYDMMLLDRQTEKEAAQFFTQDFLKVKLTFDDLERTKLLHQGGVTAMNKLREELTPQENEAVFLAFDSAIRQKEVDVDQLINSLPINDQKKQIFEQELVKLPDRSFTIDPSYVQKISRKIGFKGDYGLRVSLNAEDYKQVIVSEERTNDSSYWKIVIHTEIWKREAN